MDFDASHIDEVTEYFAHIDINNFWKSWNAKYGNHVNTDNICISGFQKADDIANAFWKHYTNIFVNSGNAQAKVHQYNELRLNYAGNCNRRY